MKIRILGLLLVACAAASARMDFVAGETFDLPGTGVARPYAGETAGVVLLAGGANFPDTPLVAREDLVRGMAEIDVVAIEHGRRAAHITAAERMNRDGFGHDLSFLYQVVNKSIAGFSSDCKTIRGN